MGNDHSAGLDVRAAVQHTVFVNCAQAEEGFSPKQLVRGAVIFTITPFSPTARAAFMEHALPLAIQTAAVGDCVTIISPEAKAGQHGEVLKATGEGKSVRFRVKLDGVGNATWVDAVVKAIDQVRTLLFCNSSCLLNDLVFYDCPSSHIRCSRQREDGARVSGCQAIND